TNWGYAPRAWIGAHLSENWSIEGRYWNLRDSEHTFAQPAILGVPQPPNSNTFFISDSSVEAYTVDLDAIRTFNVAGWQIDAQLGARHGSFSSDNILAGTTSFGTISVESDQLSSFNGTGFSYGGRMKHSLGNTNLFWVTSARGSYLSGDEKFNRPLTIATPAGGATTAPPREHGAELTIAEFPTGLEWDSALTCVPA